MEYLRVLVIAILVSWVLCVEYEKLKKACSPSCDFPAVYNFGDSNSDTGAISAAFYPAVLPYGETFFHRPVGRASDGRLVIDFIAEHLGLPYLSAYLDSIGTNFRQGANFATGSSTIRRPNKTMFQGGASPFSLDIQIEHYHQFKARTSYFYNQAKKPSDRSKLPRPEDFSKALYMFDIGQNDLLHGFVEMNDEQLRASIPDLVNQTATAIHPGFLDQHGCIKSQNDLVGDFNRQLKDIVIQLRAQLPDAALTYVDVYAAKYGLFRDAKNQGFNDPAKICCGYFENATRVSCANKANINGTEIYGGPCDNPSSVCQLGWCTLH
ncbi:hypothetical protein L1049_002945 [Liquidambar formosana]|uniref:Uncharacterized protein n=1 Tax=Liquidambar formosana TaxID=63359 RepID=A0AAP0NI52_LIQFO